MPPDPRGRAAAVNLAHVFRRRDRLAALLARHLGAPPRRPPAPAQLAEAADAAFRLLAGAVDYSALCRTLQRLLDPRQDAREVAWAVAGNLPALRAGAPVDPGRWPADPTWLFFQVCAAGERVRYGRRQVAAVLRALAGPGCPGLLEVSWSQAQARFYAGHPQMFGLDPARPTRYRHPAELYGLRVRGLVAPDPRQPGRVRVEKLRGTATLQAHNRAVARLRRRETYPCPAAFTHPCHQCPRGARECPAATHTEPWRPVACCGRCGHRGWAEADGPAHLCRGCAARGAHPEAEGPHPPTCPHPT